MTTTCMPTAVLTAAESAQSDYDAFWAGLTKREQELTRLLTSSDTFDTIFIYGDDVWLFSSNEVTGKFEPQCQGKVKDLVLYVKASPVVDLAQLETFLRMLWVEIGPYIRVKKAVPCDASWLLQNECITAGWLKNNDQIKRAWAELMRYSWEESIKLG